MRTVRVGDWDGFSTSEPMKTACHDMRFFTLKWMSHTPFGSVCRKMERSVPEAAPDGAGGLKTSGVVP